MGPEAIEEKKLADWCHNNGILCLKLVQAGVRGFPDRTILPHGGPVMFIEMKAPGGGRLSYQQEKRIELLREQRYTVEVFETGDEAIGLHDIFHKFPAVGGCPFPLPRHAILVHVGQGGFF